jgi:hypothetical protein
MCSWNYRITGADAGPAAVTFGFTEHGTISLGNETFDVRKQGWLSGHWTLEQQDIVRAEATKRTMVRTFDVAYDGLSFVVQAEMMSRCFEILSGDAVVGTIRPAHMLTRRAFVECDAVVPELIQLFAFWLAALTWRRAARNS